MISRRYRYGASFIDRASGVRFEGHHPHERPDLWKLYLHEAEGRYRNFGFEGKLHLQDLDEGNGVPCSSWASTSTACPWPASVATARWTLGPGLLAPGDGGLPEIDMLARTLDEEIPLGVVEIKGAWSKGEAATGHRLIEAIARRPPIR